MAQQKAITMDSFYRISYPKGLSKVLKLFQVAIFCSHRCHVYLPVDKRDRLVLMTLQ